MSWLPGLGLAQRAPTGLVPAVAPVFGAMAMPQPKQ
ncbi:hypothetical protein SUDANB6_04337 [Streptomyces sp. enrichment culture]